MARVADEKHASGFVGRRSLNFIWIARVARWRAFRDWWQASMWGHESRGFNSRALADRRSRRWPVPDAGGSAASIPGAIVGGLDASVWVRNLLRMCR